MAARYVDYGLTDRQEIWHGDAILHLRCVPQLEICNFKNVQHGSSNFELTYLRDGLSDFDKIWHSDAVHLFWPFRSLKMSNFKNPRWWLPPSWKIQNRDISTTVWPIGTAFCIMTHIGPPNQGCYSRKFVLQFLCVNFAYANSYVRNAIHNTFLRTKNRKFVRKYTHGLSCPTTENFRNDSELMKLPRCLVLESQQKFVYGDVCKM